MRIYLQKLIICFGTIAILQNAVAQVIDNSSTFKNINNSSYFRFHYDNDFFTNTDYYYSQGITLEYVHPALKNTPLSGLLIKIPKSQVKAGLTFNLFGYTPTSTISNTILYGDRPFEGSMSLKLFVISTDPVKHKRLASALSLGVIGTAALGEEIQTNIHRWTGNKIPKGWQHQVKNDIILNYQLNMEKKLFASNAFLLNVEGEMRAGTLHDRLGAGINFMAGHFNDPYSGINKKKVQYYLYGQSRVNVIGYDATMQGGLFNRKSPYTISSGDVSRITFQADAGVELHFRKLFFSYHQSYLSKEFRTGKTHRWGGVSLGFSL
ncbi:MAG: lipid A deacylase LpxR family protein [Bacteroidota bacterium]|nr:lipid A deacylase LpxR family protein [Bacteroidota bacterium]